MTLTATTSCILCATDGGVLIAKTAKWRVVRATDQDGFPLTYRVIWNSHIAEFSDLCEDDRQICMQAVAWVEQAMRMYLLPDKINLAALGNVVPHLHWHIIARYSWDRCFPSPVWAPAIKDVEPHLWQDLLAAQEQLERYLKNNVCMQK